ncbi:FUSC family protein [Enterobacter hormaechei]
MPSVEGQLILIVITGVLFFAFRNVQYAHATMFITLLVLLCFDLLGEGFEVALPRADTTADRLRHRWAAVRFIWPDWRFQKFTARVRQSNERRLPLLDAILERYRGSR